MNQTEKRRKKLLEQTRNLYSDKRMIPAIHPRYKACYGQLYPDETERMSGTFGIRMLVCIIIFALYVKMEQDGILILGMNNVQVLEKIIHNLAWQLY